MSFLVTRGLGLGANNFIASGGLGIGVAASTHTFDLATHWPANTVILNVVGWHAIPDGDPGGNGGDPDYGSWDAENSPAWHAADPDSYPYNPYVTHNPGKCTSYAGEQHRDIASYFRPAAGIYSGTGRDTESRNRKKLMLETVRTDTDPRCRVTVVSIFVNYLGSTSYAGKNPGDSGYISIDDTQYRNLISFYEEADALGMTSVLMPQYMTSAPWQTWHIDFTGASRATRLAAVTTDIVNYLTIANGYTSAFRVNGKLVIEFYPTGEASITVAEFTAIMDDARTAFGSDFYTIVFDKTGNAYAWADAMHPWIAYTEYTQTTGATERLHAEAWQLRAHANILLAQATHTGRVAIASLSPGFDDWVKDWGAGVERLIPRTEDTVLGQFDGTDSSIDSFYIATWDSYFEGTTIEPLVTTKGAEMGWITEALGNRFSETVDAEKTQSLLNRWLDYGIARGCAEVAFGHGRAHHSIEHKRIRSAATNRGALAGGSRSTFDL